MCGIAGCIGINKLGAENINTTLEIMKNRGPNNQSYYTDELGKNKVYFLHSRLSIIDLDCRSDQPMKMHSCVLIFNGELYNYIEIKKKLKDLGWNFHSNSDSEVIICAYRQWGEDCINYFEGMWSFALFDKVNSKIILCRDPFGEKPLYYTYINNTLYFGSQIKYLSSLSGRRLKINVSQVKRYLTLGYQYLYKKNETYFHNVFELPPASVSILTSDKLSIEPYRYWRPEYKPQKISLSDTIDGAKEHLIEAMRIRLRSDVPLAFRLSGGVDSTFLCGVAAKEFGHQINSYSIIDKDARYNERDNIEEMVDYIGAKHLSISPKHDDFLGKMRSLVSYFDAPVVTITFYLHSLLSEQINKDGFKVSFSGTGADELFTGYYDHYNFWLAEMSGQENYKALINEWKNGFGSYVQNPILKDPEVFLKNPKERSHLFLNSETFQSYLIDPLEESFFESQHTDKSLLRNRMLNELQSEKIPVILHDDDLSSMRYSIENRSPFLDRRLTDFMYTVPDNYLIKNGYSKWLLRTACQDYVPNKIRFDKQKRGFNASILSLVNLQSKETKEELINIDSPIFEIVNRDSIIKCLDGNFNDSGFSKFLFSFISAKLFMETHEYDV